MCGIAGVSAFGDYDPRLYIAMTNLGIHMQARGRKSWGWSDGNQIEKSLGEFEAGWNYSFSQGFVKQALHTRHPTTGSLVKENSHPFRVGEIIGMHNGIVHNHDELQTKYGRTCAVDSEHIFHHINEGLSLSDIRAYGAIVYWKDGDIYLGRFNNGDLTLARTEVSWVFASTENAVRQSLRFAGLNKGAVICKLEEDILYRLNGDQLEVVSKLDFGSYSKSYGSWDDTPTSFSGRGSTYYGQSGKYENGVWIPYAPNTTRTTTTGTATTVTVTQDEKKTLTTDEIIGQMIIGAMVKKRQINKLITAEENKENLKNNGEETKVDTGDTPWRCGFCGMVIEAGEQFSVTDTDNIACVPCSNLHPTSITSENYLNVLPIDIIKYADIANTSDVMSTGKFECETCDEMILLSDIVALTPYNSIICMQCFANGEGDMEAEEYAEYSSYLNKNIEDEVTDADVITELINDDDNLELLHATPVEGAKEAIHRNTMGQGEFFENEHQSISLDHKKNHIMIRNKKTKEVTFFPLKTSETVH